MHFFQSGASVIYCCYAAIFRSLTLSKSTFTQIKMITKRILSAGTEMNTSLKLSRLVANPACIDGVLISGPNFSALCGRMKL
jgi:hypothetical protein